MLYPLRLIPSSGHGVDTFFSTAKSWFSSHGIRNTFFWPSKLIDTGCTEWEHVVELVVVQGGTSRRAVLCSSVRYNVFGVASGLRRWFLSTNRTFQLQTRSSEISVNNGLAPPFINKLVVPNCILIVPKIQAFKANCLGRQISKLADIFFQLTLQSPYWMDLK